jgi:putative ABC transport system permease protein
VIRYALRALAAEVRAAPVLFLLTVLGVALGVASVLCIQLVNQNAISAFQAGVQAVSGEADLSVVGRTPTFSEQLYPEVLAETGVEAAWPLYRIDVALADRDGVFLDILGVDLLAPVRWPWRESPGDSMAALRERGWVAITPALGRSVGRGLGDRIVVTSGSRRATLVVGAFVEFQRTNPQASPRLVVMDIGEAQSLLGRPGELHQIDVRVAPGTDVAAVAARLRARLGPAVQVVTPAAREAEAASLLGAFRLNLTALSLISLFVGLFVVHESTGAALLRRRREFGVLRSLGATRTQVLGLILGEVALLGLLGVCVGLPLGYWAASANVAVVSATLTNLYLLDAIESLRVPAATVALAALIGVGGALLGALVPALDMSRRATRALLSALTLDARAGSLARLLFVLGLAVLGLASLWYRGGGRAWRPAGFALGIALLVAIPLLAPFCVQLAGRWVRVRGFGLAYSLRSLATRLQSTALAVASLAIAVSMLIGITLMIGSFRRTVEVWVDTTVRADVYVSTPSWARAGPEATLDAPLVQALAQHPGVAFIDRLRKLVAYAGDRRIAVSGIDARLLGRERRLLLVGGDPAEAIRQVREEGAALVSEPLARKAGLRVGDQLWVASPRGDVAFRVSGVYYDYSTEGGAVVVDLETLQARFGPDGINSVALYLEPGRDPDRVVDELRARFREVPLVVRSNRRLREEIFTIFDQTFAITRILQAMSLLVAVCGITLTLLIQARERVSELALCRSLGASRGQLFRVFVGQGVGIALLALGLGLAGGLALAWILIFAINRAYFGWTIQVSWPGEAILRQVATILGAAVVASVYPALAASRAPATELSREDL